MSNITNDIERLARLVRRLEALRDALPEVATNAPKDERSQAAADTMRILSEELRLILDGHPPSFLTGRMVHLYSPGWKDEAA